MQQLYRLRLDRALDAARELLARPGNGPWLADARRAAIRALRTLDRQHLVRLRRVHEEFEAEWRPAERSVVAQHRAALAELLHNAEALTIAGGHVAVLLNRLRLFDLGPLLEGRPVVAWSAGAMALADRIVLFHDSPPQGAGNAELFESGLAFCTGVIPLPHAARRLRLDDAVRVTLFARRFSPATCALLDEGARLDWNGRAWRSGNGTQGLSRHGTVVPLGRQGSR